MSEVKLSCHCGEVRGLLTFKDKKSLSHIICMCDDCQSFAHFLKREDEILDEFGGTEIYQVSSNEIQINRGREKIKCLKLSPKGICRFFASCCNTPIANMVSLKVSFAGVVTDFIQDEDNQLDRDIEYRCMSKYAKKEVIGNSSQGFSKLLTLKILKRVVLGYFNKRYLPNSFFDADSGNVLHEIVLVSKEKKEEIRESL